MSALIFLAGAAEAANFQLSVIAKSGDTVAGQHILAVFSPVINDTGTVSYEANFGTSSGGIFTATALLVQDGQSLGGVSLSPIVSPMGGMNSTGTVVFSAQGSRALFTQSSVLVKSGDVISGKALQTFFGSSINDSGTVAFYAITTGGSDGIFTTSGSVAQPGDTIGGVLVTSFAPALTQIDNSGRITFGGRYSGGTGVFQSNNSKVAKTGDVISGITLSDFGNFSVSRAGRIAFQATFGSGGSGIFLPTGVVAKTGDVIGGQTLTGLSDPAVNDSGTTAFLGQTSSSTNGVFSQGTLLAKSGDNIGGKVVSYISAPLSINSGGVVTFVANFNDGTSAVVEAIPLQVPQAAPFGSVDTPANNITGVTGAIGVTGWAISSPAIGKVALWREPVGGEPQGTLVYLTDTSQVPGARPDVAAAFPGYPHNDYGWGAQILTNELPNTSGSGLGNGTYRIHALATSSIGQTTDIGAKTITVSNSTAVLPFGTIDTPGIGTVASGSAYVNFGWVVTPNAANLIPKDGSTITVYIDNVAVGHPVYNNFRQDIATLFPGLQNSNGAVGYYVIDTTRLSNGLHTISWTAVDNVGNAQGLGSRFFTVLN